jgi:uncharacterized protein YndB with AHSA1/START domain
MNDPIATPTAWLRTMATAAVIAAASLQPLVARAAEPLVTEGIVNAPIEEVWGLLTTPDGYRIMGAAKAEIDLRIGGEIRSTYAADAPLGDEHTIVNEILAYDPPHMLAIRNRKAPADFPFRDLVGETWFVYYLYPLGAQMTHVKVVGRGFADDPGSIAMREYFARGNRWSLDQLVAKYAAKCPRCEAEAAAN